jgi:hypothetical protein
VMSDGIAVYEFYRDSRMLFLEGVQVKFISRVLAITSRHCLNSICGSDAP